jgi:NADPH2:quinone reductase
MARALQIVRHGEPEELVVAEVRVPAPGADEITIDVHAAGVNFPDLLVVRGTYQNLAPLPFSPGKEVAGVVSAVGARVTEFRVGDPVLAYVENGGYVEEITVPTFLCHVVPAGLDAADAIGLGLALQTAHFALFARGQMKPGETVLVTGATGGVGIATVQLAKACGAIVVAGCSTTSKAGFAREYGADHVVMLDSPDLDQSLKAEIAALTGGRGADVVVDNLGGRVFDACLRSLAWCGRIVVVGFAAGAPATLRSNYLLIKNIAAVGLHWSDYRDRTPALVRNAQQEIFALWRQGRLTSPVTDALRLDDAALALRRIADRQVRGKIVLLTERYAGRLVASPDPVRS